MQNSSNKMDMDMDTDDNSGSIMIQFQNTEGDRVGPTMSLPQSATTSQMEQVLMALLPPNTSPATYAFYVNETSEITTTLSTTMKDNVRTTSNH